MMETEEQVRQLKLVILVLEERADKPAKEKLAVANRKWEEETEHLDYLKKLLR